jgi:hypothetical protein
MKNHLIILLIIIFFSFAHGSDIPGNNINKLYNNLPFEENIALDIMKKNYLYKITYRDNQWITKSITHSKEIIIKPIVDIKNGYI